MKGWTSTNLPNSTLVKISAEQRKSMGKHCQTTAEIEAKAVAKSEKVLQDQIAATLTRYGVYFIWQKMSKKSALRVGTPDFIVCLEGCFVAWEVKVQGRKPTPEQEETLSKIKDSGGDAEVITRLDDVLQLLREHLIIE